MTDETTHVDCGGTILVESDDWPSCTCGHMPCLADCPRLRQVACEAFWRATPPNLRATIDQRRLILLYEEDTGATVLHPLDTLPDAMLGLVAEKGTTP